MTKIKIAQKDEKIIIENLMQMYLHDLSAFDNLEMDSQGRFLKDEFFDLYWVEPERFPYLIYENDKIVGFAFVRRLNSDAWSIAEFFILRQYRKLGIGRSAARQLFSSHSGNWYIAQLESNSSAQFFWKNVIQEYTGGRFKNTWSDDSPKGPMIVFSTKDAVN